MPEIDELTIQINAESDKANDSVDILIERIEKLTRSLGSLNGTKVKGIEHFKEQTKNVAKSMDEISKKYKDLGKGFELKGSAVYLQEQIDKLSNALARATLKKKELETSGNTDGKMYEYAVRDVIKYENQIESLKNQLQSLGSNDMPLGEIPIYGLEEVSQKAKNISEEIKSVSVPKKSMNYNAEAMAATFGEAARGIENYSQAVEQFGDNAGRVLNNLERGGNEFSKLSDSVEPVMDKMQELQNRLSQLTVPEIRIDNLKKLNEQIEKTETKLEKLRNKLSNALVMGTVTESVDDKGYVRLQEQIALTEKQLEAFREKKSEVENSPSAKLDDFRDKISKVGTTLSKVTRGFVKFANLGKSRLGLNKHTKELNDSFSTGFKNILKYAFGIRGLYVLFNKLRNAVKEGIKNLVQFDDGTNESISLLNNSLTQLKNASASMVAPLINAFAPVLNQIIQMCIKATNAVNQLFSALTGKGTWVKATELSNNYADSVAGASEKQKELNNATLGFDELHLNSNNGSSTGGGEATSASDMFETAEVSENWVNLANSLETMWEEADFSKLGKILGEKLKASLSNIPWDGIQNEARRIGKSVATLINGFVEVDGLGYSIGKTLGEAINTGIIGINAFLDNTHWDSVGKFLADGVNGLIKTIDFAEAGRGFGEAIKGILDIAINFLENTDWQILGNKIAEFIASVGWSGITNRLFEGIGAVLGGLAAFIWGLVEKAWNEVVGWWEDTAYEDGKFTMQGLLDGILEKLKNVGTWIKTNVFTPISNGIKNAFGIHSPAEEMKPLGENIFLGLTEGFSSKYDEFTTAITNWIDNYIKPWFTKEKWVGIMDKVPTAFKEIFTNAINVAVELFNKLIDWINDKFYFEWDEITIAGITVVPAGATQLITIPSIPKFATGGFPEDGLFLVNHTELVGQFNNGRTAVANNDQIIEGIKQGVYEAVMAANSLQSTQPIDIRVVAELDGEKVYDNQQKVSAKRGINFGMGAFAR